jgi:succinate dehydrogenase / fumarate reductase cytochrome b subunit
VPVGAYMIIHLLTNSSIWNGAGSFQRLVYQIHSLGIVLPLVEWTFIFIPILFHGIYGIVMIREGQPNTGSYPLVGNIRYTLQRATGLIAFVFIGWHVFHMHGWIHSDAWQEFVSPWGGLFSPYNAATTAAAAVHDSVLVMLLYLVGTLACAFHLANGLWTMGITWGVWTTAAAQRRANYVALGFGVFLVIISLTAWTGFSFKLNSADEMRAARAVEDQMFQSKVASGEIDATKAQHKRAAPLEEEETAMTDATARDRAQRSTAADGN